MTFTDTPSRASSTACAWRSWCGAKRRLTPASAACRRNSLRTAAADQGRPRVGPSITQNSGPARSLRRSESQGLRFSQPHASMPTSRRRPPLPRRTSTDPRRGSRSCSLSASAAWTRRGVKASEPEFANACLVEAEVVTNLVTHRLDDVFPEAVGIVPEVAHERVAKDQDLVWQATAPEERATTQSGADVHAVCVV